MTRASKKTRVTTLYVKALTTFIDGFDPPRKEIRAFMRKILFEMSFHSGIIDEIRAGLKIMTVESIYIFLLSKKSK